MTLTHKKILFLVTEDWYFCSHRLPLAVAARNAGYEVVIATRVQKHGEKIKKAGLTLVPISMRRRSKNPLRELSSIFELVHLYRKERPDIVHHVALKPVVYGSIAAWMAKSPVTINAIAGLGFVFSSKSAIAKLLKPVMRVLFRLLLNGPRRYVIMQNPDDVGELVNAGVLQEDRVSLIRGAGVDLNQFPVSPEPNGLPKVMLASRMLWDKGVGVFVEAAKLLKKRGVSASFVLVGGSDGDNPNAISQKQLKQWHQSGVVEWWGRCSDMPKVFEQVHIFCLPSSYGEGVPKVLIEAASSGRPIVTTDWPGCREVVKEGENGFLVTINNSAVLADALEKLIDDKELRVTMGRKGRRIAENEFSVEKVIGQTLSLYQELLN